MDSGIEISQPEMADFHQNENFMIHPDGCNTQNTEVEMGPNIKPFPRNTKPVGDLETIVTLHAGDNITTDDIMPSDSRLLPYRSNVPHLSNYCFEKIDAGFAKRCQETDQCTIVGGENYGQGSSREHAALAPLHLGVKSVIAKSFARIHRSNLINSGIIPLVFCDQADYDDIEQGDALVIENVVDQLNGDVITVVNKTKGHEYKCKTNFQEKELKMVLAGGKINYIKSNE
jgi:aconitate hydratase